MANKYLKKCSTFLAIREEHLQVLWDSILPWLSPRKQKTTHIDQKRGILNMAGGIWQLLGIDFNVHLNSGVAIKVGHECRLYKRLQIKCLIEFLVWQECFKGERIHSGSQLKSEVHNGTAALLSKHNGTAVLGSMQAILLTWPPGPSNWWCHHLLLPGMIGLCWG